MYSLTQHRLGNSAGDPINAQSATPAGASPADTPPSDTGGVKATDTTPGGATSSSDASSSAATTDASSGSATSSSSGSGVAKLSRGVCEAIATQVGATVKRIRDKNVACETAHDCEIAPSGICNLSVGCGVAVSLGKGREVQRLAEEATRDPCKAWRDGDCPTTLAVPIPSCPQLTPMCVNGRCSEGPTAR